MIEEFTRAVLKLAGHYSVTKAVLSVFGLAEQIVMTIF